MTGLEKIERLQKYYQPNPGTGTVLLSIYRV